MCINGQASKNDCLSFQRSVYIIEGTDEDMFNLNVKNRVENNKFGIHLKFNSST